MNMNRQSIAILSDRLFSNPSAAINQAKRYNEEGTQVVAPEILDVAEEVLLGENVAINNEKTSFIDPLKYINKELLDELIKKYNDMDELQLPEAKVMSEALTWSYNMRAR